MHGLQLMHDREPLLWELMHSDHVRVLQTIMLCIDVVYFTMNNGFASGHKLPDNNIFNNDSDPKCYKQLFFSNIIVIFRITNN